MANKDTNQAMQDLVVDAMRRSQEAVVDLVRSWRAQWDSQPFAQPFGTLPVPPMMTLEQVNEAMDALHGGETVRQLLLPHGAEGLSAAP